MINIGLKSEYIFTVFGIPITNTFFTSIIVTVVLVILSLFFYAKRSDTRNIVVNGIRILIFEALKLADVVTQNRKLSKKVLPLVMTFFLFIVMANLIALVPGFLGSFYFKGSTENIAILRSPNSDLTITLALALISVFATQIISLKELGTKNYIKRFLNFANPIKFVMGFFELISEAVKILSFSFRLFGNIFAGEVLLLVIAFLVPYFIPLPFMILELFVGILQAFIFAILTLTFIKTSLIHKTEPTATKQQ